MLYSYEHNRDWWICNFQYSVLICRDKPLMSAPILGVIVVIAENGISGYQNDKKSTPEDIIRSQEGHSGHQYCEMLTLHSIFF